MQRTTIDFGIDLGTTNSAISVMQGGNIETIKNGLSEITPSLVYYDKRGTRRIGLAALDMLNRPATALEVQAEFKRVMGQRISREFKAAGKSMTPEELSAEVLMELRRTCATRFGEEPTAAVITVPAMFELPQNESTANAAKLAGFTYSQLLQEPVAAAVAYGFQTDAERAYWLVYDYGGGTFDASIVAIRDGQLTGVKHAGDNYLGGADLDWKLVEEAILPSLINANSLKTLSRSPTARDVDRGRMLVLKRHAETIKKLLSTQPTVQYFEENVFEDDNGDPVDLECTVTRERFNELALPAIDRSIELVEKLIEESGIPRESLNRFVLVGGSTFIPLVRQRTAALGIPMAMDLDPMTVVSRGAAIFASSQRLPSARLAPVSIAIGSAGVQLDFEPMSKDLEPLVGGKVAIDGKSPAIGTTIYLERDDHGWNSGDIAVDAKGMFFTTAKIRDKGQSVFEIRVRDANRKLVPCSPSSLAITYGLQVSRAILPQGVGIALADGSNEILHDGGSSLPSPSKKHDGYFTKALRKGSTDRLEIRFLSGDDPIAEYNMYSTLITISGGDISKDIPVGTKVEIYISIDASGVPSVSAFVPLLDERFEPHAKTELKHEAPSVMRDRKRVIIERLEKAEAAADTANLGAISNEAQELQHCDEFDAIDELIQRWEQGDEVAAGQARNQLVGLSQRAATITDRVEFPQTLVAYNEELDMARKVVAEYGDASDRKAIEEVAREGVLAIKDKDPKMLRHCDALLTSIRVRLIAKDPAFWVGYLAHLATMQDRFPNRAEASRLLNEGAQAANRRDTESVRSVVQQLMQMLPNDTASSVQQAMGSDVM